ncbi:MAG: hypothetical protein Q8P67_21270, partial [archaeon]|nr:hypothetical protein [archaeon]
MVWLSSRSKASALRFSRSSPTSSIGALSLSLEHYLRDVLKLQRYGVEFSSASLNTLLTFMQGQAQRRAPTLPHTVLTRYHVDSVTIQMTPTVLSVAPSPGGARQRAAAWLHMAFLVEAGIRSLSNLVEHLHQSFYYYLLPSSDRYVSIGVYVLPLAMVSLSLILDLVSLVVAFTEHGSSDRHTLRSALACVFFYLVGLIFSSLAPSFSLLLSQHLDPLAIASQLGLTLDALVAVFSVLVGLLAVMLAAAAVSCCPDPAPDPALRRSELRLFGHIPLALCLVASALLNYSLALYWAIVTIPLLVVPPFFFQDRLRFLQGLWVLTCANPAVVVACFGVLPLTYSLYFPTWMICSL